MRSLTVGQQSAIDAASVTMVWFIELGFSTPAYLCTARHSLSWNSHTWLGAGQMVSIDSVTETDTMEATGYSLSVTLTSSALVSLALSESVQGDTCKVYLGLFDADGALIGTPPMVDYGICDQVQINDDKTACAFKLTVESEMANFSRPRVLRYTNADHQQLYSGDKFFEYVEQMAEKAIAWPSRELLVN